MTTSAADPKRRALGKGLDSLLPRVHATAAAAPVTAVANEGEGGGKPLEILLEQIDPNPYQTRTRINEDTLAELAASIAANGVIQPILVRPQADGRFQLIAGRAALAGLGGGGEENDPCDSAAGVG